MTNYIEFGNKIAFHPGYYVEELVENSGLTQADFAKRLDTSPKNLSDLINAKQSLSIDIAAKLSRLVGTSIEYWLNLQSGYDALIGEQKSIIILEDEKEILRCLEYSSLRDKYGLPNLARKIEEQIFKVREFLQVSSLTVLKNQDLAVNFRSSNQTITERNLIKANAMVQIAINRALRIETLKYDKKKFESALDYALTLTEEHENFYKLIKDRFSQAGVALVILPNLPGSKINGATKLLDNKVMLMVNDRRLNSDTFWFTLFHEAGHIINKDYGVSFNEEKGTIEQYADEFARDKLIPKDDYKRFILKKDFSKESIINFGREINRAPSIILGRLKNDGYIGFDDTNYNSLIVRYKVKI